MRSPFPWFGGKGSTKIQSFILEHLPPHSHYIEPFGGGASILFGKPPASVEVYNDVNRGVVNFFRVIADEDYFGKFMARSTLLPVSRVFHEEFLRTWVGIGDPVEQAVRWFYVVRNSFSANISSWSITVNSSATGMAASTSRWRNCFERLPEIHDRLQRVQIECADWRDVLSRYAGDGWLAYCDPPYVLGARKAGGYEHELKDSDHEELIDTLLRYDGAVVLSGYDHPLYAPLKKAGWDILTLDVSCFAAGRTKTSGLQGIGNAKSKQSRTEVVWRNPEAMRRIHTNKK